MNFLKSVFSDDPDPPESETSKANKDLVEPERDSSQIEHRSNVSPSSDAAPAGGGWNFEGLIRTLSSKSETIIDTYRRDLKEFGSGLKKEIEGAQGSLGTVGIAIDEFGNCVVKGTAQIISQGKEAFLAEFDSDNNSSNQKYSSEKGLNSKRYSRFDAQVSAIQGDASTYCDEPECLNDYNKWKSEFSLEGKSKDIERCLRENDAMESIYKRVVPNTVDHETFWIRYYYKVYKLKKAEDVRARLVRGMSREEEDLSWDVEDDDDEEHESKGKPSFVTNKEVDDADLGKKADAKLQAESCAIGNQVETKKPNVEEVQNSSRESAIKSRGNVLQNKEPNTRAGNSVEEPKVGNSEVLLETGEDSTNADSGSKESIKEAGGDKASKAEGYTSLKKNVSASKSDDKVITETKADDGKASNKDNDSSLAPSHLSSPADEEDLGWDEIEDLSSIDEKRGTKSESPNKVDPRKRLSVAAVAEDLSWDIEDDDDEPTKA